MGNIDRPNGRIFNHGVNEEVFTVIVHEVIRKQFITIDRFLLFSAQFMFLANDLAALWSLFFVIACHRPEV